MIYSESMSNSEIYRINGALPCNRIENLIDIESKLDAVSGIEAYISEAKRCFPGEDFLHADIDRLRFISKRLRGQNKVDLEYAIAGLEDLQSLIFNQGDYGRDELRKAKNRCLSVAKCEAGTSWASSKPVYLWLAD